MTVSVTDDASIIQAFNGADQDNLPGGVSEIGGSGGALDAVRCEGTTSAGTRTDSASFHALAADAGGINLTGRLFLGWAFTMQRVDTFANGGWRIRCSTQAAATANYDEWDVGGNDKMVGQNSGFQCFAVDPTTTPNRTAGAGGNAANTSGVCVGALLTTSNGRIGFFNDLYKSISVTRVQGGTLALPGLSSEVADNDRSVARGTFQFIAGAYFLLGRIEFGNTAAESHFHDSGVDWLFQDQPVGNHHGLAFVGGASTNEFSLGSKVGTGVTAVGVNGGLIHRATSTSPRWYLEVLEPDIDVGLYGVQMSGGQLMRLEGGANVEALSCTFVDCDTISIRNGAILRDSVITNSAATTGGALDLGDTNPATDSVRDLQINNSSRGILLQGVSAGTTSYDFRNITFNGNTFDVRVDFPAGATININILDGGDAPTIENVNGSTVNVNSSVTFQLDNVVAGSTVYVEATAGGPAVAGTAIIGPLTEATTTHSSALNYAGDQPFRATITKASGSPNYAPETFSGTITNAGFTRRLSQQLDE